MKGRAPTTGYSRDFFGPNWADADRNGCDTRNDILRRDLNTPRMRGRCIVLSGMLRDPYSGRTIRFVRGVDTSILVQVDHVVALGDAYQKGAQRLSSKQRLLFANDPLNLLAVDDDLNQQKRASDAATWLPPNKGFRCEYVSRQALVKRRYDLWVTSEEKLAMERVLGAC